MQEHASRPPRSFIALVVASLTSLPEIASAATLQVPHDHETVSAAMLAASPGDTVLVHPGRYQELIRVTPGTVLRSAAGPDSTVLVGPDLAEKLVDERLMEILEGGRDTVVEGFRFEVNELGGAAIYVENASPTIRGNVIDGFGWGINLRHSKALVEDNEIMNCRSFGVLIFASSPELFRNSIHDNSPTGINISGKESHPLIGGSPENANKIYANERNVINGSRNDIDATYNDWGWETTAEMEADGYPADIEKIMDGNDLKKTHRGRGKVDYRHWVRPQAASAASTAEAAADDASPMRMLVPLAIAVVLIAGFVGVSRRRRST